MDPTRASSFIASLENILRLSDASNANPVPDASVLSCGCLVSESRFLGEHRDSCPSCNSEPVHILGPIEPLRELYKTVKSFQCSLPPPGRPARHSSGKLLSRPAIADSRKLSVSENLDLLGIFCKYAKEEQQGPESALSRAPTNEKFAQLTNTETVVPLVAMSSPEMGRATAKFELQDEMLAMGLTEEEERNFSLCFPFHRKISSFTTQQNKLLFSSRSIVKTTSRFVGSAMCTRFDYELRTEVTSFLLISDRKWELYEYAGVKPVLVACGRLTGEFGPDAKSLRPPQSDGLLLTSEFARDKNEETNRLAPKLKQWVHLFCHLSPKFLVISGTNGVLRVLNADASRGPIGLPVYTYLTDFPIRCISAAPNSELVACGITTREKISGKQQPFVILHHITFGEGGRVSVSPVTITVPYRDPLKIISFNASSSHILCCTVYELRYFVVKLRNDGASDYKRPRLIFSDVRTTRKKPERGEASMSSDEAIDDLKFHEDDDQMLDNEGITDVQFGRAFTNTIVITSSSLKSRYSLILKLNGQAIDAKPKQHVLGDMPQHSTSSSDDDDQTGVILDVDVLMTIPEIGSNIYRVAPSPRGDSMLFVDKLGRLLLVLTPNLHLISQAGRSHTVVLLGEVTPSLRYSEAASACFSSDGGKIMVVDRKGNFQVFDFTKGVPGEDPEVIKCKIISV